MKQKSELKFVSCSFVSEIIRRGFPLPIRQEDDRDEAVKFAETGCNKSGWGI